MKRYGMRIGNIGVEFASVQDRDKGILTFIHSSTTKICDSSGIRYTEGDGAFSVYERETNEILANCHVCTGTYSTATCSKRSFPKLGYDHKTWSVEDYYFICDGCLAKTIRDKEIADAKVTLQETVNT